MLVWHMCYNGWTSTDSLLLTKVWALCTFPSFSPVLFLFQYPIQGNLFRFLFTVLVSPTVGAWWPPQFEEHWLDICRMPLCWYWCDVFLLIILGFWFGGKTIHVKWWFHHIITHMNTYMISTWFISVHVGLDHWLGSFVSVKVYPL